jgi:hypothetical protein
MRTRIGGARTRLMEGQGLAGPIRYLTDRCTSLFKPEGRGLLERCRRSLRHARRDPGSCTPLVRAQLGVGAAAHHPPGRGVQPYLAMPVARAAEALKRVVFQRLRASLSGSRWSSFGRCGQVDLWDDDGFAAAVAVTDAGKLGR